MAESRYRAGVLTLTLLWGSVLVLWALLTPGFRAADEPQHFNSVIRLLDGGGWPEPGEAQVLDGVRVAAQEAGWAPTHLPFSRQYAPMLPRSYIGTEVVVFVDVEPGEPSERAVTLAVAPLDPASTPPAVDQMTQHPPGYYAAGAALLKLLGAQDWRWDSQLLAVRLLSAAMVTAVVPLVASATRNLRGSPAAALTAAASVLAVAQLGHVGGSVSNDALVALTGAVVVWCASRALARPPAWPLVVGTGVALGVGLLTKVFLLAAIPMVALAFVCAPGRTAARRSLMAFSTLTVAFAVGGWWWARNLVVYGTLQPHGTPPQGFTGAEGGIGRYLEVGLAALGETFWGSFGWLELRLPPWTSLVATTVVLLGALAAVVLQCRERGPLLILLTLPVITLPVLLLQAFDSYTQNGFLGGLQGRYLFGGIAPLLVALGIGVARLTDPLPRAARVPVRLLVPVGAIGYAAYGLLFAFRGFYQPHATPAREALDRWAAWSQLDLGGLGWLLGAVALLGLTAVIAVAAGMSERRGAGTDQRMSGPPAVAAAHRAVREGRAGAPR